MLSSCRPYRPFRTSHRSISSSVAPPLPPTRVYLYSVDHHGQLFLIDTKVRNFTTNIKAPSFLDFFYSRMRANDPYGGESARLREEGYSFVSPCGPERNYIKPDVTPLVFQKLTDEGKPGDARKC